MAGLPSVIGPYRVVRQLGRGGMGTVYEAIDDRIGRRVAIKLLHQQFVQDPEITRRMFNEARAANQIAHPGMALISEFGQTPEGTPYLVMEFLSGPTLRERLAGPPLTLAEILDIATQMASTLLAVHQKGIVHRDLKPENVLLVQDASRASGVMTKILDFGVAKRLQNSPELVTLTKTPDHRIMGTPAYMAPEQCLGAAGVDAAADVYSFGIMLYELISGQIPFSEDAALDVKLLTAHLTKPPPPLAERVPDVPPALAGLIERLLHKQRESRPRIEEVLSALRQLASRPEVLALGVLRRRITVAFGEPVNALSATVSADGDRPEAIDAYSGTLARTVPPGAAAVVAPTGGSTTRPARTAIDRRLPRRAVAGLLLLAGLSTLAALSYWAVRRPGARDELPGPVVAGATAAPNPTPALTGIAGPGAAAPRVPIRFQSEPTGARVLRLSDGAVLGTTPFSWDATAVEGKLTVRFRRAGYRDLDLTVDSQMAGEQAVVLQPMAQAGSGKPGKRSSKPKRERGAEGARTPLFE
jgi:hypothetical protein